MENMRFANIMKINWFKFSWNKYYREDWIEIAYNEWEVEICYSCWMVTYWTEKSLIDRKKFIIWELALSWAINRLF
jgi:hypothetical protein